MRLVRLLLLLPLALASAFLNTAHPVQAQASGVEFLELHVTGPDASGNIVIQGKVRVWGVMPWEHCTTMLWLHAEFLKEGGKFRTLPEAFNIHDEWKCYVRGGRCLTQTELEGVNAEKWPIYINDEISVWLKAEDEGRVFDFHESIWVRERGYERMRVVAELNIGYDVFIDSPVYPLNTQLRWDESQEYDLSALSGDLAVQLLQYPEFPTPDQTVEFRAYVTGDDAGPEYKWYVDGNLIPGKDSEIYWEKPPVGEHNVEVVVTNHKGQKADAKVTFTVKGNSPPKITSLTFAPAAPKTSDVIEFRATATDPDNDPLTFHWYVDEGHMAEEQAGVFREKLSSGEHEVVVEVVDPRGESDRRELEVNVAKVENRPPKVRLECKPPNPKPGDTVVVSAVADDPDGDTLTFRFFDTYTGREVGTDSADPDVTMPNVQEKSAYSVRVIVYDGKGGKADATFKITVGKEGSETYCFADEDLFIVNGEVRRAGARWKLKEGDVIQTGSVHEGQSPGSGSLQYPDGATVKVKDGTRLQVGPGNASITVDRGTVHVQCSGAVENTPTVSTPAIVAVPEGTEFEVLVAADGTTTVRVFDGQVRMWSWDMTQGVTISAAQFAGCAVDGAPSAPQGFNLKSAERWWEPLPEPLSDLADPGDCNADGRCTEVDALCALQMAVGGRLPDSRMDVTGDGRVTEVDALQILKWAVSGGECAGGAAMTQFNPIQTEQEAIQVADQVVAADYPDMVGAQRTVSEYTTPQGEYYDVLYQTTVQIESAGSRFEWPRMIMVTIDKRTGQHSADASGQ